jgi:hypothetical protein
VTVRGVMVATGDNSKIRRRTRCRAQAGPAWVREMDDDTAFMQLVLSNAQGELSPLERGMHALAATEKGKHNGHSVDAYALATGRKVTSTKQEIYAASVYQIVARATISPSDLTNRTRHLAEIHAAPQACWPSMVKRLLDAKWNVEQTNAAVKAVLAVKPPRGYEKLFAIEKLQEMAAAGQDPTEATRLAVRATTCELTHSAYRYTLWM